MVRESGIFKSPIEQIARLVNVLSQNPTMRFFEGTDAIAHIHAHPTHTRSSRAAQHLGHAVPMTMSDSSEETGITPEQLITAIARKHHLVFLRCDSRDQISR